MTEEEIGDLWRKPENYMTPLAFGAALLAVEREACAKLLNVSRADALLACGEMTAQEWRTVSAVLSCPLDWLVRRLGSKARGRFMGGDDYVIDDNGAWRSASEALVWYRQALAGAKRDESADRASRTLRAGAVAISCMAPEARDCLDAVMEQWREHWARIPESHRMPDPAAVYGFAYWLLRYSGLVTPNSD